MSNSNADSLTECAMATRRAGRRLASTSIGERNAMLAAIRSNLLTKKEELLAANHTDMEAAQKDVAAGKLSPTLYKRLDLSGSKWNSLIAGLETVMSLKDPLGKVTYSHEMTEDGLRLYRLTCPIGVVLVIFEARPEAAVQIASLCIKSGNALLLKGGSEAKNSNAAIVEAIREAIEPFGMADAVQSIDSRSAVDELLRMDEYIDVVVPRGSNSLVKYIKNHTSIPVLGHADGICHTYIHSKADPDMAIKVTVDAKTQYPAVCNATETILVDQAIADSFIPRLFSSLRHKGVTVHGDSTVLKILGGARDGLVEARGNDFDTEWCSLECSMHVVPSLDAAVDHINVHGSHHTDCIITGDPEAADEFMRKVDSAGVYWNASTRFADGFRYGFGAEVGVSTNRIHARGPMGLEGLTICKYRLYGNGHTVTDYGDKLLPPSEEPLPGKDETELRKISAEKAREVASALGKEEVIGVDCEGVMLGRFGQLCTIQIATERGDTFMFDACRDGVAQALAPLLSDASVLKVFHDCREDSSALYHQHGITLECVFDTQATMLVGDRTDHQTSYWELVRQLLFDGKEEPSDGALGDDPKFKALMAEDPELWRRRPLPQDIVNYAISGCLHLIPLYHAIQTKYLTSAAAMTDAIGYSDHWVSYRHLNPQLKSAADVIKPPEEGVNRQS
ncbi:hypothetical protein FOZ62_025730 [Perkinsus olseni]|uniref:glutamate-5-semialdehyde dehydrogenase n=1 Tax=Perkinsus olseni TaxID=32597 RepID=A0A7J6SPM5_PEROL|nr:hypothetical protein FOZ62_025730 [Perkinsus olseni]